MNFITDSPTPDSKGVLDRSPVLLQKNKVSSFHQQIRKKQPQKSNISGKNTCRWTLFLLKTLLSHRRPSHTSLVKTNPPVSSQIERWNELKYVNGTYMGNII